MKSRWLNILIWAGLGILWVGLIVALDIRAHEDFGWRSTISWGMAQLGTSHPLVAFLLGGLVFGTAVGLATHFWSGATMPNPTLMAEIDRLAADVSALTAERDHWKSTATTYYPPDGSGPIVLPITDVRVRLAEDAARLAAAEKELAEIRVRLAELEAGVGPVPQPSEEG